MLADLPMCLARVPIATGAQVTLRRTILGQFAGPGNEARGALVQLRFERVDALGDQLLGPVGRQLLGDQGLRRGDRCINRHSSHLAHRVGFGSRDLLLGEFHAAVEMLLHRFPRLGGEDLRLLGGKGDDALGFVRRLALFAAIIGEYLLGLVAQAARLFQLLADQRGAGIEGGRDLLVHAEIEDHADKDEERYGDPEFRLGEKFHGHSLRAAETARATSGLAGAMPISRRTISAAVSEATASTSLSAKVLAARMRASASADLAERSRSSATRSAATSSFSLLRASCAIACARALASARACS